jgi:hypothetical protein
VNPAWSPLGSSLLVGVTAAAVFLVAALVRERRSHRRKAWRLAAIALAALALWFLVAQPTLERRIDRGSALVLTAGATRRLAEESGLRIDQAIPVVALPGADPWSAWVLEAPDVATFLRHHPEVARLELLGDGLEPWDLEGLSVAVDIVATPPPGVGVGAVMWSRELGAGDTLEVTGSLSVLPESGSELRLVGPDGAEASVELTTSPGRGPVPFSLQLTPPRAGRFLYDLVVEGQGNGSEAIGSIDVQVREADPPAVLWLEGAPSFETRFVKEWLVGLGGELAIRSRVSRDRYHFEYHHLDRVGLDSLTPDLLGRFDLLVVDQRSWVLMTVAERVLVTEAVEDRGMGLLLRLDPGGEQSGANDLPLGFTALRLEGVERLLVQPPGAQSDGFAALETVPFELELGSGTTPLFEDRAGRLLAVARPLGRGTVGGTLLRQTYPWILDGQPAAHRRYWSRLLEVLSRPSTQPRWHLRPGPILVDEPLDLELSWSGEADELPAAAYGPADQEPMSVAMRQDPLRPGRWTARVWPSSTGWHRVETAGADLDFWVADSDAWPEWQRQRRARATRLAAARGSREHQPTEATVRVPAPRLPAFLLLLACLGALWLDERRG